MTLTLRIYDESGTEIVWVTANPYDYEITHPDGTGTRKIDFLDYLLDVYAVPEERGHANINGFQTQTAKFLDLSEREHLEYIVNEIDGKPQTPAESFEIADE
jgi:hypothetical protein